MTDAGIFLLALLITFGVSALLLLIFWSKPPED